MNWDTHAALILSFLVVALTTIALHPRQGDPVPPAAITTARESRPEVPSSESAGRDVPTIPASTDPTAPDTQPTISRPTSAFTQVREVESLVDVARRVYGSPSAVERLWKANRDVLGQPDVRLEAETVLRTPSP
jgi:nucleoid-associated protein YgaU